MDFKDTIAVPIENTRPPKSRSFHKINISENELESDLSREVAVQTNSKEDDSLTSKQFRYSRKSAAQLMNDLNYLNKTKMALPNVHFEFRNGKVVGLHSLILLARSDWFRRCWRSRGMDNVTYDFNVQGVFDFNLNIYLKSEIPEIPFELMEFSINGSCPEDNSSCDSLYSAFKNFKEYLYRGSCQINEKNSSHLIAYSAAFQVYSLRNYLCDYFIQTISEKNTEGILDRLVLAHKYKLDNLKISCIQTVNRHSIQIVNSTRWENFALKYPTLVIEIFRSNN